jgi:hypothetical protein
MLELWLFASFGECQIIAQPVARRLLGSRLIQKDFWEGYQLLARGNFASGNLNHQKRARAQIILKATTNGLKKAAKINSW